jgi:peptide/nickel transport system substrate-binding protein
MTQNLRAFATAAGVLAATLGAEPAWAQKSGGILKMYDPDSPASMSILEEGTVFAEGPMMGVFNNLVMYDQHVPQDSLQSIVPDRATGWSWNEDGTELIYPLREGVAWHDGKPFTARDVQCTFDMLTGKSSDKLRVNPRKSWYHADSEQRSPRGRFGQNGIQASVDERRHFPEGRHHDGCQHERSCIAISLDYPPI